MKKINLQSFTFLLLLFVSCSSDSEKWVTEEVSWVANFDQKNEYSFENGVYIQTKMHDNTTSKITNVDGTVENKNSVDSTDLPDQALGEYNNFQILEMNDKQVVLVNSSYSSDDDYNTKTNWKFTCEITNGSLTAYNAGETIEVKSIDDSEYDKASEAYVKAIVVKSLERADPYQTTFKTNTSNHVFLISKKNIKETVNSSLDAVIKLLKEVKE
jgi:hypothetical protein